MFDRDPVFAPRLHRFGRLQDHVRRRDARANRALDRRRQARVGPIAGEHQIDDAGASGETPFLLRHVGDDGGATFLDDPERRRFERAFAFDVQSFGDVAPDRGGEIFTSATARSLYWRH